MATHTIRALGAPALAFAVIALVAAGGCQPQEKAKVDSPADKNRAADKPGADAKSFGKIERQDPRFDKLIPRDARIEKLADGFEWAEGALWVADGYGDRDYLLFSDVPRNVIYKWKEGQPGVTEFLKPSGYTGAEPRGGEPGSNGLTLDPQGRLVLCEHGDRRVARLEADGKTKTTLADRYDGKRFNSPNDLCYDSKGNLYFTDPPYGLVKNVNDPAKELEYQGVFRLSPDGVLFLLTKEMSRPNGVALSPDEKTLYVANSDSAKPVWMAFERGEDGNISNGRVFFDASALAAAGKKGLPDGLKVDQEGNLFATGPGGLLVIAPDGTHLGTLDPAGEPVANCNWGNDGSTLYITADSHLCRIRTGTKGNNWRPRALPEKRAALSPSP